MKENVIVEKGVTIKIVVVMREENYKINQDLYPISDGIWDIFISHIQL